MATKPVRVIVTVTAYLLSLPLVAVIVFFVVIFLAGPHAALLPHAMEVVVIVLGWLCVLALPAWIAWQTWKRLGSSA